jgi:hypothetical protein
MMGIVRKLDKPQKYEYKDEWLLTLYGENPTEMRHLMVDAEELDRLQRFGVVQPEDIDDEREAWNPYYGYAYGDLHAYDALQEHLEAVSR